MGAGSDSDYGEEFEWDEDAETQLSAFEATSSAPKPLAQPSPPQNNNPPRVEIDVEAAPVVSESSRGISYTDVLAAALAELGEGAPRKEKSLWERYRKRRGWGGLSVSDLVGPSWCEVQHSYRLQSRSHLPPAERPTTIVTSAGTTVALDQKRTVAREVVLDKGRAVHKVLEKDVMGDAEPVKVEVGGKEEWWALRLLNTIVCLETLIATGRAREIPVVGFVGEFLVFGVIDEVDRRELPSPRHPAEPSSSSTHPPATPVSKKPSPAARTATVSPKKAIPAKEDPQRTLDPFFSPVPSPTRKGKEKAVDQDSSPRPPHLEATVPRWGFVLSDTKTRYRPSLPPKNESHASRLQLMLYHRLLTSLLTRPSSPPSDPSPAPTPFAWTRLYTHLSLSPSTQFTATFIDSIQPILVGSSLETTLGSARTLEDFVAVLQGYGDTLGAKDGNGPFGDELEISYVMRETTRKWKPRRKTRKEREEEDVAKAIAESLNAVTVGGGVTEEDEEEELARALAMSLEEGRAGPQENGAGGGSQSQVTVDEGATMDEIDSQQEALPFFLDPSLLTATPNGAEVSPAPSFDPLDLPSNSQASPTELDIPVNPRYSLRRRRHPSADITSEAIDVAASPVKRSRSSPAKADLPSTRPAPPPVPAPSAPSSPEDVSEGTWIGTEKFKNNPEELSSWLEDVTRLWMGERPPRGVSMEQTSRCRTCEFEDGCEWRAMKAAEELEANRMRARSRE